MVKKYIPILKLKRAEIGALSQLCETTKSYVTPLFEVLPSLNVPKKYLHTTTNDPDIYTAIVRAKKDAQDILISFGDNDEFIVDTSLLLSEDARWQYIENFIEYSAELYLRPRFSISTNDNAYLENIMKKLRTDNSIKPIFCIRINIEELANWEFLRDRLTKMQNQLSHQNTLILIDLKEKCTNENGNLVANTIPKIKAIFTKNTPFSVACGAFPKDMTSIKIDDPSEKQRINRNDYSLWFKLSSVSSTNIVFADYTIRHPIYDQSSEFHQPSSTIKYTTDEYWQILRGTTRNHQHYIANAKLLTESPEFYGKKHCAGDNYITEKGSLFENEGENTKKTGNATTWLQAGIVHHITVTVDQILRKPGS